MKAYLLLFLLLSTFSYSYLRMGIRCKLRGYALIGIGVFLIGAMFLFLGFGIWLPSVVLGGIGFVVMQVGFGVVMTRERIKDRLLMRRTHFLQRLTGRIPPDLVEALIAPDSATLEGETSGGRQGTLFAGLFSIAAGILLWLLRGEYVYPALLVATGAVFVVLAWRVKR